MSIKIVIRLYGCRCTDIQPSSFSSYILDPMGGQALRKAYDRQTAPQDFIRRFYRTDSASLERRPLTPEELADVRTLSKSQFVAALEAAQEDLQMGHDGWEGSGSTKKTWGKEVAEGDKDFIFDDASLQDGLGSLDWRNISRKGQSSLEHIQKHSTPAYSRKMHGVFIGEPQIIVEKAWAMRANALVVSDGMGGTIYNIPYPNAGYNTGYIKFGERMDYVTIIVESGTSKVWTAFPSFGDYGLR